VYFPLKTNVQKLFLPQSKCNNFNNSLLFFPFDYKSLTDWFKKLPFQFVKILLHQIAGWKKLEYLIGNWKGLICKRATDTEYEKSLDDHTCNAKRQFRRSSVRSTGKHRHFFDNVSIRKWLIFVHYRQVKGGWKFKIKDFFKEGRGKGNP